MLLLLSCAGTEGVKDDSGDGVEDTAALVSTAGPDHCGHVIADETWAADLNPHTVTCNVSAEGGVITVGPGTELRFGDGTYLAVSDAGTPGGLEVVGTEADPVLFTIDGDPASIRYGGLILREAAMADRLRLENLTVEYTGYPDYGTLQVYGASPRVTGLTLRDGGTLGFVLSLGGHFADGSSGLRVSGFGQPGRVEANQAGSIPEEGASLTGNVLDAVIVSAAGSQVTTSQTWGDIGVPYWNTGSPGGLIDVEGTADAPTVLTLDAGVDLWFDLEAGIAVSIAGGPAALRADGTAENPVTVSGFDGTQEVNWGTLYFDDDTDDARTVLQGMDLGGGGRGNNALGAVHVNNASITIANTTIHDSVSCGIYLEGDAAVSAEGVTYANNAGGDLCE